MHSAPRSPCSLRRLFIAAIAVFAAVAAAGERAGAMTTEGMVLIPAGDFVMGSAGPEAFPHEGPPHLESVKAFWIDQTEVTVKQFRAFVAATRYETDGERLGWGGVFEPSARGWTTSAGACWKLPDGPAHGVPDENEPVVQVSLADAEAYASWAGKRLPTETEWERAARGGLISKLYPWGDQPTSTSTGRWLGNWWQGNFPVTDRGLDGYRGRAPVGSFPPNGYGLFDVAGNVWEWTSSPFESGSAARTIRGGSWLCSDTYCTGYRVAARNRAEPDSGLNNLGFRCARDAR